MILCCFRVELTFKQIFDKIRNVSNYAKWILYPSTSSNKHQKEVLPCTKLFWADFELFVSRIWPLNGLQVNVLKILSVQANLFDFLKLEETHEWRFCMICMQIKAMW